MSRSFAKPAFSRTVTIDIKQWTTSTQNTFTFQNYLSYFGRWLEKSNELRSNWRSAPPPTAPPSSLSSTCWLDPFSSNVKKGKDTSMLGNVDEEDVEKDDQDQGWLLGWATNLGNGDEEDVEKNDQGWLLGWATNLGGAAGRGACSLPNSPLCISSPTSSSLLLSIVRLIIIIFSCHSHPQHCRLSVLSLWVHYVCCSGRLDLDSLSFLSS